MFITHVIVKGFRIFLDKKFHNTKQTKMAKTHHIIVKHFVTAFIYLVGIGFAIYAIPALRTLSVSLFAGAGVIAIIVGFAAQESFANVISGLFIAVFTPFRVGDQIKIVKEDVFGVVDDINLRHTTIKTYDNKRIVIPNSVINKEIITNYNLDDEKICEYVEITVSYDTDLNLAMKIMADECAQHPSCVDKRTEEEINAGVPKVKTRVINFEDSGIKIRACPWSDAPRKAFLMHCDLRKSIKEEFEKHGVEIPYPYRTLVYKKDLGKKKKK